MSFDRDRRGRSNDESERNERTRRARAQAQTQRGARPYQYLTRVGQPSREQAAILDQMILRRGLENVQELGERGELPEGCNTPMGEQVRVARVRSSWKAGVELDTESAMRSVEAQTESDLAGETATPDVVRRVISQPGRPLEGAVREEMEARMGDSFGDVQLHTGPEAAKAASALEARAFTTGNHVVFNRGEYDPESPEGKYLLAHELAHVRQQTGGAISMLPQEGSSLVIDPDPALEHEADEVAKRALEGEAADPVVAHRLGMDVHVQRLPVAGALESIKQFKSMMDFNREAREARQESRAAQFDSMGQTDGNLEARVSALERNVSELGGYVAEQVGPSESVGQKVAGEVGESALSSTTATVSAGIVGTALAGPVGGVVTSAATAAVTTYINERMDDAKPILGMLKPEVLEKLQNLRSEKRLEGGEMDTGTSSDKVDF